MSLRIRRSVRELQDEYDAGNKKPLEELMRAWKAIKELPPEDPQSFFTLGGYHGAPFRGAGWGNSQYWGGYCHHGNVLFPTWHRVYLIALEKALQSVPGCEQVMMPYWDETSEESLQKGIPWALTNEKFELDGKTIDNPLRSFIFTSEVADHVRGANPNYSKPEGYETVRYPLSGLVGTKGDREETEEHNKKYPDHEKRVELLNTNVVNWLDKEIEVERDRKKVTLKPKVKNRYIECLKAPNYTVFSNTSSAAEWNRQFPKDKKEKAVVPLESPHNHIHLAIGGFDVEGIFNASPIRGANGDMGENDTAGLDPIFFFHHCFIDRVFWLWQVRHDSTDHLEIISEYPGTNSVDEQGPTPGVAPNSWLTLDSPLDPFKKEDGQPYTSRDCVNIEKQLGYAYSEGSLEQRTHEALPHASTRVLAVSGINRSAIRGSFLISAFAEDVPDGNMTHLTHLGTEAVLSRWNVNNCANCQTHLEAKALFDLDLKKIGYSPKNTKIRIKVQGRAGEDSQQLALLKDIERGAGQAQDNFRIEIL